jgi:hypothetical protein
MTLLALEYGQVFGHDFENYAFVWLDTVNKDVGGVFENDGDLGRSACKTLASADVNGDTAETIVV